MTSEHTYKVEEIVGSSTESIEDAIQNAISRTAKTVRNLEWFEVRETRGRIEDGRVRWYQVKVGIGFRVEDPA